MNQIKKKINMVFLTEPTDEVVEKFIKLYLRFLKEKKLYHYIRVIFPYKKNEDSSFIGYLRSLNPLTYFDTSPTFKGWRWSDLEDYVENLDYYNHEWRILCFKNKSQMYNWRKLFN